MERDEEKTGEQSKTAKKTGQTITAYIGLQNEPLGDEPNISISFAISLRLFCAAFAISRIEKEDSERKKEPKESE